MPRSSSVKTSIASFAAICALVGCAGSDELLECHAGAWQTTSGKIFTITASTEDSVRIRTIGGVSERLFRNDEGGFEGEWQIAAAPCDARQIFVQHSSDGERALRVPLSITETSFEGAEGTQLAGRLIMPPGNGQVPLTIFLHGSESYSGRAAYAEPWLLGSYGIGAFVYDKRGTGASGGKMTQDFSMLALDAAAALRHARAIAAARAERAGYWGGSQGARIATKAAQFSDPDFIVAAFGAAGRPSDEDREEVLYRLRERGYGPDVLVKAREVAAATAEIRTSGFERGFDALTETRRKYADEPWFAELAGEYTGDIASRPAWMVRLFGPLFDRGDTVPWTDDSRPAIAAYEGPQLWVLAADDDEAPSASTIRWLRSLQARRPELQLVVFPDTTHGIRRFTTDGKGDRILGDYAPSYLPLVFGWIKHGGTDGAGDSTEVFDR